MQILISIQPKFLIYMSLLWNLSFGITTTFVSNKKDFLQENSHQKKNYCED